MKLALLQDCLITALPLYSMSFNLKKENVFATNSLGIPQIYIFHIPHKL